MLKFKQSVSLNGIKNELVLAIIVAKASFEEHGADCIITSVCDGSHSKQSLHYAGCAVDFRTRHVDGLTLGLIVLEIQAALPDDEFDVIREETHLHIEWQPKRRD